MTRKTKPASFWQSVPLEALAEEQGVGSVEDVDDLSKLWPVDDDPDALLQHILGERAARRGLKPE